MRKLLLALAFCLAATSALAQNVTCATRPPSDNSNACASTAFVQAAAGVTTLPFTSITGQATLAQLPNIANNTLLGNITGGSTIPAALSTTAFLDATIGTTASSVLARNGSVWAQCTNCTLAGSWTVPSLIGGTLAASGITLQGTSNGSPSGDFVRTKTGAFQVQNVGGTLNNLTINGSSGDLSMDANAFFTSGSFTLGRIQGTPWFAEAHMFSVDADVSNTNLELNDTILNIAGHSDGNNIDNGATRAIAQVNISGSTASTSNAWLRASEHQLLLGTGTVYGAGDEKVMEVGLHSQIAGNGTTKLSGIQLFASHSGWLPSGMRADSALYIFGEDGWTHALHYVDTDGSTVLADIDQFGSAYFRGVLQVGNVFGSSTATAGEVVIGKIAPSGTAPGAGTLKLSVVAGTTGGTCKIIAYAGTSTTPTTVIDNVGAGC